MAPPPAPLHGNSRYSHDDSLSIDYSLCLAPASMLGASDVHPYATV